MCATGNVAAAKRPLFAEVLGLLQHSQAKGRLAGEITEMTKKVSARPFRDRPRQAPPMSEIVPAIPTGHHGKGILGDERDHHAVGAKPRCNLGRVPDFRGGEGIKSLAHAAASLDGIGRGSVGRQLIEHRLRIAVLRQPLLGGGAR
jgi:hypothetical protein